MVAASREALAARDFVPFAALGDAADGDDRARRLHRDRRQRAGDDFAAAWSREIMRGAIGFDGLIVSDDLSMKALGGPFAERTRAVFAAGLDIALHCNGDLDRGARGRRGNA